MSFRPFASPHSCCTTRTIPGSRSATVAISENTSPARRTSNCPSKATFRQRRRPAPRSTRWSNSCAEPGARSAWEETEPDRVLATVLFTDIVGSSEHATALGDREWRKTLEQHHELVRRQLVRFRGREVDTAGDGFFASFDGPARAIKCACAISESVGELGLDVRAGLHTGECEVVDGKVAGIAVHTGARVAWQAQAGEVLVSSTVKDLVAGSEIQFADRGVAALKGIPGEWRLFAGERLKYPTTDEPVFLG